MQRDDLDRILKHQKAKRRKTEKNDNIIYKGCGTTKKDVIHT